MVKRKSKYEFEWWHLLALVGIALLVWKGGWLGSVGEGEEGTWEYIDVPSEYHSTGVWTNVETLAEGGGNTTHHYDRQYIGLRSDYTPGFAEYWFTYELSADVTQLEVWMAKFVYPGVSTEINLEVPDSCFETTTYQGKILAEYTKTLVLFQYSCLNSDNTYELLYEHRRTATWGMDPRWSGFFNEALYAYTPPPPLPTVQCSDGIDNDGDGYVDMDDLGCDSVVDDDEYNDEVIPPCTNTTDCSERFICIGPPLGECVEQECTLDSHCTENKTCKNFACIEEFCGDSICNDGENRQTCLTDCPPLSTGGGGGSTAPKPVKEVEQEEIIPEEDNSGILIVAALVAGVAFVILKGKGKGRKKK